MTRSPGYSEPSLRQAFAGDRNSVVGNMGFTMRMMLEPFRDEDGVIVEFDGHGNETGYWVQRAVESEPDAIVIELGGNDLIDTVDEGVPDPWVRAHRSRDRAGPRCRTSTRSSPPSRLRTSRASSGSCPTSRMRSDWVIDNETHTLTDMRSQANAEDNTLPGRVDRLADVVTDVRNLHAFDDMNFQLLEPERAGWLQGRPRRLLGVPGVHATERARPSRCRTASTHRRSVSSCTPST